MWRLRLSPLVVLLASAGVAHAGALGKTVGGIHGAAGGGNDGGGGSGNDSDDGGSSSSSSSSSSSGSSSDHGRCCGGEADSYVTVQGTPGTFIPGRAATLDAYFGIQSVKDSNGSMTVELRATYDDFGIGAHDSSFWEEPGPGAVDTIRLDLWGFGPQYRLLRSDDSALWGEASIAGVNTVPELSIYGLSLGIKVDHRLGGDLSITAQARGYTLQHDVRALEVQVALQAAILRVSYRVVDFNVGPPLAGPEIGIAMRF